MTGWKKTLDKGIAYLKRNGVKETLHRTKRKIILSREISYESWLKNHSASEKEKKLQKEQELWKQIPLAAVVFPEGEKELDLTIESLKTQTFGKIAVYTPEEWDSFGGKKVEVKYVLLIQNGTILRPEAVYEMTVAMQKEPDGGILYTDHDIRTKEKHYRDPFCKPEYDSVLQSQINYLGTVLLIKTAVLKDMDRMQMEKIWQACMQMPGQIRHLPKLLYHISETMQEQLDHPSWHQAKILQEEPLLSVIIPNKDHSEDLVRCVDSILEQGGYENLEILIVENNSILEQTFQTYQMLQKKDARIQVMIWEGSFNYSAINNKAAEQATGEYLLFLNNDTKIKEKGALRELMRCIVTEGAGAAGCRLVYEDDTIQHGGVVLGYGKIAGHAFEGMPLETYEKHRYASVIRQMTAVTAACMVVKRSAFQEIGGFTEELCVAYNDIDLCMKLQKAGWMVLYDPKAQLYHYESQTRGLEMSTQKAQRVKREAQYFTEVWKKELEKGDCFYSPLLTLEKADFSLKR